MKITSQKLGKNIKYFDMLFEHMNRIMYTELYRHFLHFYTHCQTDLKKYKFGMDENISKT